MIVCYVLKLEDDGYHIDAVIRDRVQTRIDLYKVGNTATANDKSSSVDITVSEATEITDYTVEKQWNDAGKESERPEIDVNLYDNQGNFKATAELNKDNNWTYTFENLDKKDSNGNDIQYTAKEVSIDIENGSTTIFDEGDTNGNYIVSYNTEAGKTVITNTYSQSNITVEKTQKVENDKTTVEYSDEITYTITAKNDGTAAGSVTIKDDVPENTTLKPDTAVNVVVKTIDDKAIEVSATTIEIDQLKEGYPITVEAGRKVEVSFTVIADGYAGENIENTAEYKKADEKDFTETNTVESNVEDTVDVVTTTTTQKSEPQKVILLLDYSNSMNNSINGTRKIKSMKSAVNTFLDIFLKDGTTENEVKLIQYASDVKAISEFSSNPNYFDSYMRRDVTSDDPMGGTNIHAALEDALDSVGEDTTVILMTDGEPTQYRDYNRKGDYSNKNGRYDIEGNASSYDNTAASKAETAASNIKNKFSAGSNTIYTIGFGIGNDSRGARFLARVATPASGDNKYSYNSSNEEQLINVFSSIAKTITETTNTDPVAKPTTDGKITLEGIEVGQNVELYTEYDKDDIENSTLYKQPYSWNDFLNLTTAEGERIVIYNNETETLTFDLGAYMQSEGMNKDQNLTIRFVDPNAESRIAPANILSFAINAIADDTINEKTVSTYEEKINEAEASKDTENAQPTDTNKPENVETTKPDNAAGNAEDSTENTTEGENTTEDENTTDQEETDMPTVEKQPEQPEQPENPTTETPVESENTIQETTSNIDMQKTE